MRMEHLGPRVSLTFVLILAGCGQPADESDASTLDAAVSCTNDDDCDDGAYCDGAERCASGTCEAGDDPCGGGTCDEDADTCEQDCTEPDADGDGARKMGCGGLDCDDTDPSRYPGFLEVCDIAGHDEDCDPATYGVRDGDGDGWPDARCCNGEVCGTDCDDTRGAVHPTQVDICNATDDDCDGAMDEGITSMPWAPDCDGDGHARTAGEEVVACEAPAAPPAECGGAIGATWSTARDDCDDAEPRRHGGGVEICDGLDNDCDGALDGPGEDDDGDGHADACAGAGATDCDDTCATCHEGAPPLTGACDGLDHDCDGSVDEGVLPTWYRDADGDGVGVGSTTVARCALPAGYAASAGDCNDGDLRTDVCSAPLTCRRGLACACEVTLVHGRDYFDIDSGEVRRTGVPFSAADIRVEWGGNPSSPPIPWFVRLQLTGDIAQRHFPMTALSAVDATYTTALVSAQVDELFTSDRVIVVRTPSGGLYKLGHPQRVTAADGYDSLRFLYAPIGTPPAGFACAAP